MQTASSAKRTCSELRSASEYTATVEIPSSLHAQITRRAISPRFATRILLNMSVAAYFLRLGRIPNSGWPYSTGCPFSTNIRRTSPVPSDSISFINFMASTMHNVCPSST